MQKLDTLKELLELLGLENNEAITYLEALKLGTSPASSIANKVGVSRTSIRYTCEVLVKKGLMIASKKGNTKLFTPESPEKIKNLLIIEKNKLEIKEKKLNNNFTDLLNLYNPYTKISKTTFYEGEEGIKKLLEDHLKENMQIDSFVDLDKIVEHFSNIQSWYNKQKEKLNIKKRSLISITPEMYKKVTKNKNINSNNMEIKYFNGKKFNIVSYLYEGKLSYISLREGKYFGIIIEDEEIYSFQKSIFNFMWEHASDNLEE